MKVTLIRTRFRSVCNYCRHATLEKLMHFESVPIFLGCTTGAIVKDKYIDFDIFECKHCHLISTNAHLENDSYSLLHSEAVGKTWKDHHQELAKFIEALSNKQIESLLEIGPSSRPVARIFSKIPKNITYLDMLIKVPFSLSSHEHYLCQQFPIKNFFRQYDVIIASHVFEHTSNPKLFFSSALNHLKPHGLFIISIPNFLYWLDNSYWNGITPEHTQYPFLLHLQLLAQENHVKLVHSFFQNHSLFCAFYKDKFSIKRHEDFIVSTKLVGWYMRITESLRKVEQEIMEVSNRDVFLTGASHLSQYPWLMSSLLQKKIKVTLDNSLSKAGQRVYGTRLITRPFDYLKIFKRPVVVVFSSPYQAEFIDQVKTLNHQATIILG